MTTGRINQVAFLFRRRHCMVLQRNQGNEEAITGHEHRPYKTKKCIASSDQGRNPSLTRHSASRSTVEHQCTDVATPIRWAHSGHRAQLRSTTHPVRAQDGHYKQGIKNSINLGRQHRIPITPQWYVDQRERY